MKTIQKSNIRVAIEDTQNEINDAISDQGSAETEDEFVEARDREKSFREILRLHQLIQGGSAGAGVTLAHQWGIGDCPGCSRCAQG